MTVYGLLIGIAIVISIELLKRRYQIFTYIDLLIILIAALIGARLLFLLHNIEEVQNGTVHILQIWDGGLAFYGGLLGIIFALLLISRIKKVHLFDLTDPLTIYIPLAQSIGRIGNYFNNELYGKPTSLPWGIYIPKENRIEEYNTYEYFHPTFIYESILTFSLFILLYNISKKIHHKGITTAIYLIGYALIRLLLNTVRIDKEYLWGIETSDLFSLISLITGIVILVYTLFEYKRHS